MIILDANVLISLGTANDSETKERIEGLLKDLVSDKTVIGIPTPVIAEYLYHAGDQVDAVLAGFRRKSVIRVLPFDEASAIEAALIYRSALQHGSKRGAAHSKARWAAVKTDRMILAIAKTNGVEVIYTDDGDMAAEASRLGIEAIATADLPLPPKQHLLIPLDGESPAYPSGADVANIQAPSDAGQGVHLGVAGADNDSSAQ